MDLAHTLHRYFPLTSAQSAAEIDAEIREELEYHLEMRTEDNERAGMKPDEARRDARQRFGDFEANRAACRKITLGPQLLVARLQWALVVLLIGAVVYQGVLLLRLQSSSRDQIDALTQMVEQLQAAREPAAADVPATMPYLQLNRASPYNAAVVKDVPSGDDLASWRDTGNPVGQSWSDWGPLDESPDVR